VNGEDFDEQFHLLYEKLSFFWKNLPTRKKILTAMKELIEKYVEGGEK
jgi:hypothetical protein